MAMKLAVISTLGWGLIICMVVGAVWLPASLLSADALIRAREDQLQAGNGLLRRQILNFFEQASKASVILGRFLQRASRIDPVHPPHAMIAKWGDELWYFLSRSHNLGIMIAVMPRNQSLVRHPDCDLDGISLSATSLIDVRPETTGGANQEECHNYSSPVACGQDTYRVLKIQGEADPENPLGVVSIRFDIRCRAGVGSSRIWMNPPVSDASNSSSHGLKVPTWSREVFRSPWGAHSIRVFNPVFFDPLPLPPALAITHLILAYDDSNDPTLNALSLPGLLADAVKGSELRTVVFILNADGEVIGNSIDRSVALLEDSGKPNLTSVPRQVATVADSIISTHCTPRQGVRSITDTLCSWGTVSPMKTISGFTVSSISVEDKLAVNLGLLVVSFASNDDIRRPAEDLNVMLAIVAPVVLAIGCLFAFLFSLVISRPILSLTDLMLQAAKMRDLEEIALTSQRSVITEINLMAWALLQLVQALVEYKRFLPRSMIQDGSLVPGPCEIYDASDRGSRASTATCSSPRRDPRGLGCYLRRGKGAIMVLNKQAWTKHMLSASTELLSSETHEYVSVVVGSLHSGSIDRFNGDRVVVSWNTLTATPSFRTKACQTAHAIRSTIRLTCPLGIGIACGALVSGNAGSDAVRSYNIMGTPLTLAWSLSEVAARHAKQTVVLHVCMPETVQFIAPATGILVVSKLKRQGIQPQYTMQEMLDPLPEDPETWVALDAGGVTTKIVNVFKALIDQPEAAQEVREDLYALLKEARAGRAYADDGWTCHLSLLATEDPETVLYHHV